MEQADKIEKAIEELARRENDFATAARAFANAEGAYRLAKAIEYLKADGTIPEREAVMIKNVQKEHKAKLEAEAVLSFTKEKLLDCRQVVSARQSILSAESKVHYATKNFTA